MKVCMRIMSLSGRRSSRSFGEFYLFVPAKETRSCQLVTNTFSSSFSSRFVAVHTANVFILINWIQNKIV